MTLKRYLRRSAVLCVYSSSTSSGVRSITSSSFAVAPSLPRVLEPFARVPEAVVASHLSERA